MGGWRRDNVKRDRAKAAGPHPDLRDEARERVEPVGSIVRRMLSGSRMSRGIAVGRLVRAWERIVGTRLAAETSLLGLEEGTLIVAASGGGWASQVRFLATEIAARAGAELGSNDVRNVRVVVRSQAGKSLRDSGF